jgi:hypothetical protein
MTLRDYLCVPYLVEAALVEDGNDGWLRAASHPELPDCSARSSSIVKTLDLLDRQRITRIVALLQTGHLPPLPRAALPHADPEGALLRHGLHAALAPLLDLPVDALANRPRENAHAVT